MTMSTSKALKALDELVEAGGIAHYERALTVIRSRLEVNEEMVEQACTAYFAPNGEWPCFGVRATEIYRRQMKAALVAALGDGE